MAFVADSDDALAQEVELTRIFSLDSRYFVGMPSSRAIGQFGLDMANLAVLPADLIGPGSRLRNAAQGLTALVFGSFVGDAFTLSFHELGHGTRNSAIGFKSLYGFGTLRNAGDGTRALASGETHDNFFSYYFGTFASSGGGFALRTSEDAHFTPFTDEKQQELSWDVVRRSGGMNNEMYYTEFIEQDAYRGGSHVGFLMAYLTGKLSASRYSDSAGEFGDLNRVVAAYEADGLDIDKDKIDRGSQTAFYLSGMSYQLFYQTIRVFLGKSFRFRPWEVRGVQMPSTAFYMTRSGLSYKFSSGYRWGSWRFPVGVERIFEGESRTELSLGGENGAERLGYGFNVVLGKQVEVELEGRYSLDDRFVLSGGYALYDVRNLHGERLIPSLEHGSRFHEFYIRGSLVY